MSDPERKTPEELKAEYLAGLTVEELEAELARRNRPRPRPQWKSDQLVQSCESHMEAILNGTAREDADHYIYETAMISIYGPNVFDWINERMP